MSDGVNGERQESTTGQTERVQNPSPMERSETSAHRHGSPEADEWTTAALAHASVLVTFILAFAGGVGALAGLLVPLVIYLSYRDRSRFIAFQALQSLAYQSLGIVLYVLLVAVLATAVTVAWVITGLLSVAIIGFLLVPLALLVTAFMVILLLGIPVVWAGYGLYAGYQVYVGGSFRYWLLGEWVEGELMA